MYDRHIETKKNLVFINENEYVEMDTSSLGSDVAFYVESEGDWWIERKPFNGREKNDAVRQTALQLLAKAEEILGGK
jgi:hypothetical protein